MTKKVILMCIFNSIIMQVLVSGSAFPAGCHLIIAEDEMMKRSDIPSSQTS